MAKTVFFSSTFLEYSLLCLSIIAFTHAEIEHVKDMFDRPTPGEHHTRLRRWVGVHYRARCRCDVDTGECTCTPRIAQGMWSGPGYYNGSGLAWANGGYRCVSGDNCRGGDYPGAYPNSNVASNQASPFNPASYTGRTYSSFVGSPGPYYSPHSGTYFYTVPHNLSPPLAPPARTPTDLR